MNHPARVGVVYKSCIAATRPRRDRIRDEDRIPGIGMSCSCLYFHVSIIRSRYMELDGLGGRWLWSVLEDIDPASLVAYWVSRGRKSLELGVLL